MDFGHVGATAANPNPTDVIDSTVVDRVWMVEQPGFASGHEACEISLDRCNVNDEQDGLWDVLRDDGRGVDESYPDVWHAAEGLFGAGLVRALTRVMG